MVVDEPPTLSARARLLDSGSTDKTDPHDARSAAIVVLRHPRLRVVACEDHAAVLRLLAKRHHDLTALRTQAVCRLHTVLCLLSPGGAAKHLSADQAAAELRRLRPTDAVALERKRLAAELPVDVRRLDKELAELRRRITVAVTASGTGLTDIHGVGPIVAAYAIGYSGDIVRFPPPATTPATTAPHPSRPRAGRIGVTV